MGLVCLFKLDIALALLIIGACGGLAPLCFVLRPNKCAVRLCNSLAGGVLLSASLVHMLPDACKLLEDASQRAQRLVGADVSKPFSLAPIAAGLAFLVIALLDAIVRLTLEGVQIKRGAPLLGYPSRCTQTALLATTATESNLIESSAWSAVVRSSGTTSAAALLAALAVHSILEGIGIGAQRSLPGAIMMFLAVSAHKGLAGFALGTKLVGICKVHHLVWAIFVFSCCSPAGIVLGAHMQEKMDGTGRGLVIAFSSGTFLYVAVPELLVGAWREAGQMEPITLVATVGFVLMSFLAFWA